MLPIVPVCVPSPVFCFLAMMYPWGGGLAAIGEIFWAKQVAFLSKRQLYCKGEKHVTMISNVKISL